MGYYNDRIRGSNFLKARLRFKVLFFGWIFAYSYYAWYSPFSKRVSKSWDDGYLRTSPSREAHIARLKMAIDVSGYAAPPDMDLFRTTLETKMKRKFSDV